jgi:hypothetical protein
MTGVSVAIIAFCTL